MLYFFSSASYNEKEWTGFCKENGLGEKKATVVCFISRDTDKKTAESVLSFFNKKMRHIRLIPVGRWGRPDGYLCENRTVSLYADSFPRRNRFSLRKKIVYSFSKLSSKQYEEYLTNPNILCLQTDEGLLTPCSLQKLDILNEEYCLAHLPAIDQKASFIAKKYHSGQVDKAGKPYYYHPLTVASSFSDEKLRAVAFLHDTLEDTSVSKAYLEKYMPQDVADAVEVMTRRAGEDYDTYIRRVRQCPMARQVKMADLRHNMDLSRLKNVTPKDLERCEKYKRVFDFLNEST